MGWSDLSPIVKARALRHDSDLRPEDPADPFRIADQQGIETVHLAIGEQDKVEGGFLRRQGRAFILVNSSKPGRRQRFTCAHELGHASEIESEEDAEFVDLDLYFDQDRAPNAEEREANLFAAELLMPEVGVQVLIAKLPGHEDAVGAIVRRYNVSPISAAVRLCEIRGLDRSEMAALRDRIENDWRAFWREQDIPRDVRPRGAGQLPELFRDRAKRLLDASVISPERYAELLERPLPTLG